MKYLYPFTLAAMAVFASCSKDHDNPPPQPVLHDTIQISFSDDKIGLTELYESYVKKAPTFSIKNGEPNKLFSYELTGSNGLEETSDTITKGIGKLDASGNASLSLPGLVHYKDGEITVKVTLDDPDTEITAKAQKIEYQIRNYTDFIYMGYFAQNDTSDHYVQVSDFAFPDTVFTTAVSQSTLSGSYDGQGHKITNLTIKCAGPKAPSTSTDVGLFYSGYRGSVIKNIQLELSEEGITSIGEATVGGIVGHTSDSSWIINCSVKGNITLSGDAKLWYSYAGGITGWAIKTNIIGCSYRGDIYGPVVGGIAGLVQNQSTINVCYAVASLNAPRAGGIIGIWSGPSNISNSYAFATTQPEKLGAIASQDLAAANQVTVTNCFANAGTTQDGVTILSLPAMNTALAAMEVTNWPQRVTPPANNKPYKNDTDPTAPMKLWWE